MKKSWIFWVWLLFIIPLGCEKELSEPEGSTDNLVIEEAKQWYYTQVAGTIDLKSGKECKQSKVAIPEWNDTRTSKNKQMEIVEVGLKVQGGWGFITETSHSEWLNTNNQGYLGSNTRLVIKKNLETGKRVSFLMTLVGDKSYLEKKKFRIWLGNSYLNKEKDFSGLVFFHDLNGSFVNGWRYTSGKVTQTIKLNEKGRTGPILKSAICNTTTYYKWTIECIDWFYFTVDGNHESPHHLNGTTCTIIDIESYGITDCYYDGGGGYFNDQGGGSANNIYILTAEEIFTNEFDKINLNGSNVFERVVCLIRDLYFNNPGLLIPEMFYGSGDRYIHGHNLAVKKESIFGHEVKTVVVYDYDNLPNQIQKRTEKHGSMVVFHEIRVRASMNSAGEMPRLISLQFKPEDDFFCEQVFLHIKGEANLWNCE